MDQLLLIVILLIVGYAFGKKREKDHYKSIREREIKLYKHPYVSFSKHSISSVKKVKQMGLVCGSTVVASDYFKDFISNIKTFFGGKLTSYESLIDRGRREAILRMREKASDCDVIVNTKIETVFLNSDDGKVGLPQAAVIAYGTAITYEK